MFQVRSASVSSVKRKITDTFSRTVSGSLGTSSSGTEWKSVRGTWGVSSSQGSVSDDASTYPINAVNFLENANVSANVSGGTGVMFWGTDANSWWASTVQYSTDSFSVNTCPGSPTSTCSGNGCTPSNCCSGISYTSVTVNQGQNRIECQSNTTFATRNYYLTYGSVGECNGATEWPFPLNYCSARNSSLNGSTGCYSISSTSYTGTCSQTVTSSGTNYISSVALLKSISGTVSTHESIQIDTNVSALTQVNSIKVTTSGNDVSIQVFGTAGLLNKIGSTITRTITSPIKGIMVGLIKSPSSASQGSTFSNFTAER
jgi:hypothetical protein